MKVATPARNDSYADDTWPPLLRPAPPGATHDKLTSKDPLCNGLRAFATRFFFCLSPAGNGRDLPMADVLNLLVTDAGTRQFSICLSSPHARRRRPDLQWGSHRACGKASSGRFSVGVRLRTSARDNVRSRTG